MAPLRRGAALWESSYINLGIPDCVDAWTFPNALTSFAAMRSSSFITT
jgi:hypothetical protein